jgi:hypothetical protein
VSAAGLTTHASTRLQQRSIPGFVVELLERCGSEMRCGKADRLFFDKAARKRLRHHLGGDRAMKHIDRWMGVYAIVGDDGSLVTVAHRSRRLKTA